jgi:hypothetical protein
MKTRVLEETKSNFEKEFSDHINEGWVPLGEPKPVVISNSIIFHTIVLQKWEDNPKEETQG